MPYWNSQAADAGAVEFTHGLRPQATDSSGDGPGEFAGHRPVGGAFRAVRRPTTLDARLAPA